MAHSHAGAVLIDEIETALRSGSAAKRVDVLMSVTDLFAAGADKFSDAESGVFDDVIGHLVKHVESRALVELSRRLADMPNAPVGAVRALARDDSIDVSGPVLASSSRLNDEDLVEIARTKSQAHLASIARRTQISEAVTEALVDKGNATVVQQVASNPGAAISGLTMEKLAMRADGDANLTESLCRRKGISPAMFRNLTLRATEQVRSRLLASAPPELQDTVKKVVDDLQAQVGRRKTVRRDFTEARRVVAMVSQDTRLTRMKLKEFAYAKQVNELIVALSVLSGLGIEDVDALYTGDNPFGLLVLLRASGIDRESAHAVLDLHAGGASMRASHAALRSQYDLLTMESAQQLMHFWAGRQRTAHNFK